MVIMNVALPIFADRFALGQLLESPPARFARYSLGWVLLTGLFSLLLMAAPSLVVARGFAGTGWTATWTASPQSSEAGLIPDLNNQTVRMIIHATVGGNQLRIRLSNAYGTQPLLIGDAHVAVSASAFIPTIVAGTDQALTFGGQSTITIPVGAVIVSDPVRFSITPLTELAVSLYLPNDTPNATLTEHYYSLQVFYISPTGDYAGSNSFPDNLPFYSWCLLSSVEVAPLWPTSTVVALGDSITDGVGSTSTLNDRWPDLLAARLYNSFNFLAPSVVNQGIAGNRLLHDITGQNALARFDRDVLSQAGVRCVIIQEGLNDVATAVVFPNEATSANQIIWALNQLIQRGHDQGLLVLGVTLTPFSGSLLYSAAGETERQAVNQFIRSGQAYDGVLDFDQVVRDPSNPTRLLPAYDSGDHVHPNDAGYQAIVQSIDLSQFLFLNLAR
jgi:lysophospholipase L1-like esterase